LIRGGASAGEASRFPNAGRFCLLSAAARAHQRAETESGIRIESGELDRALKLQSLTAVKEK
jgi:hypothetical protein